MNPIVKGWYADPEVRYYDDKYWVYVTKSFTRYKKQLNIDAFSSEDGINWEKHENIIEISGFPWIKKAVWAPTIIEKNKMYYLIFASNDIKKSGQLGGLEIACAKKPSGPFKAILSHPLLNEFVNGAQPIDAHLFKDDDGCIYLYYGGWGHCNVVKIKDDLSQIVGEIKEVTPPKYVEAPCMLKKNGLYHFMWSSGNWMMGNYRVLYAVSESPYGPFVNPKCILKTNPKVASGPGHHGWVQDPKTKDYHIYYHRRILRDLIPGHRILCKDKITFDKNGHIMPIVMT